MRRGWGGRARETRNCVSQLFGDIRGGIPGDARGRSPKPERPGTRLLPTAREKPGRALVELLSQPVNSFGIVSCALAILDNADFHEEVGEEDPILDGEKK